MGRVDVLVVGAGASGMAAAIAAARAGRRVLALEKMNRPGKKLLATGNGRCNYTNLFQEPVCYRSGNPEKAWRILQSFDQKKTVAWFREMGVLTGERQGYLYPASFQASALLRALEREMDRLGVEVHREETVEKIALRGQSERGGYLVYAGGNCYSAGQVIVSAGGMASPVHGSAGEGYGLLAPFSLAMEPVYPALCPLLTHSAYTKKWAGNRVQGKISLTADGRLLAEDRGEIQLVAQGISGIPVFQVSRYAASALAEKRRVVLHLDSMPGWQEEEILEEWQRQIRRDGKQSLGDLLEGMLPDKLAAVLIGESGLKPGRAVGTVSWEACRKLAGNVKRFPVPIHDTGGFDRAQVTRGGISLEEVDPDTLEVKKLPGLYLTGELLDVDGICGGYNLQWAWTTGYLAGSAAGRRRARE